MADQADKDIGKPATAAIPATQAAPATPTNPAAPTPPATPSRSFFDRYKKVLVVGLLLLVAVAVGFGLGRLGRNSEKPQNQLTLYGNVDLRQVELAFNNSERIAEVLVKEGDKVTRGQILARLDTSRLQPEEASAKADLVNAEQQWRRLSVLAKLTTGRAISQQDLDSAKAALDMAQARLAVSDQKLADAELVSPSNAVVRSRLLEPGEMISPQKPVLNLAITDPKWIRAYVSETDLGKIHEGMKASISADSFPGRSFSGWVGFISSVAEFTPKEVQTEELRPSLVYEVRIFIQDPQDEMRLGMPATVSLELNPADRSQP